MSDRREPLLRANQEVRTRLRPVAEYVTEQNWPAAYELIRRIVQDSGDELIEHAPGRYGTVRRYTDELVGNWPSPGQVFVRSKLAPIADAYWQRFERTGELRQLERQVAEVFHATQTVKALRILIDSAWDGGRIGEVSEWVEQLERVADHRTGATSEEVESAESAESLRMECATWKVLALLANGASTAARDEIERGKPVLQEQLGTLAGERDPLATLLQRQWDSGDWDTPPSERSTRMVGSSASHSGSVDLEVPVVVGWTRAWGLSNTRREAVTAGGVLAGKAYGLRDWHAAAHAVSDGRRVFVSDGRSVLGFELADGRPAWYPEPVTGDEEDRSASAGGVQAAELYSVVPSVAANSTLRQSMIGRPHTTLSLSGDRLLARLGVPASGKSIRQPRDLGSVIVCLDIGEAQGRLLWTRSSSEFEEGALFECTPMIVGDTAIGLLRWQSEETSLFAYCLSLTDGRPIWVQHLRTAITAHDPLLHLAARLIVATTGRRVFIATEDATVFCLDRTDGGCLWATDCAEASLGEPARSAERVRGLVTPVYWQGRVFVSCSARREVTALSAGNGRVLWRRPIPDAIDQVLGVQAGVLVVGGRSAWGIDALNGRLLWGNPDPDPEFEGIGRGLLTSREIWWPTRERLVRLSVSTGVRTAAPFPLRAYAVTGGNLAAAGRRLVICEPHRLVVWQQP